MTERFVLKAKSLAHYLSAKISAAYFIRTDQRTHGEWLVRRKAAKRTFSAPEVETTVADQ